jgi:hypothetical protein
MLAAFFGSAGPAAAPARPHAGSEAIHGKPIAEGVRLELLSATQWRVCDTRWSEHDARSLLGFIEKKDDIFEAMQLDHGFEWFTFDTLTEATAHFTNVRPDIAVPEDENILSWLRSHA